MGIISLINTLIMSPAMFCALFVAGGFISLRIGFFFLRKPKAVFYALTEKGDGGGVSPFRALTVALAGTLGVGNIVGIADAIRFGGAGAVFWMWVSAITAMSLKYAEVALAVKFRRGGRGGAFYYIRDALGRPRIAAVFAVLCVVTSFTLGNAVQVKAAAVAAEGVFGVPPLVCGIALCILCALVVFGGIRKISDFTVKMIPAFCVCFAVFSLVLICANAHLIPSLLGRIFAEAVSLKSAGAGIGSYTFLRALRYGCTRGIVSNEAGCGTAPIAHAAAKTNSPAKQGCYGIFEVFTDTVVLCTLTAFVMLIYPQNCTSSMMAVIGAFAGFYGNTAAYAVCISILFFAFSTLICWSYYGTESLHYLSASLLIKRTYLALFCLFCIAGAVCREQAAWALSDLTVSLMTVINCVCLCFASGHIEKETRLYLSGLSACRVFPDKRRGRRRGVHR